MKETNVTKDSSLNPFVVFCLQVLPCCTQSHKCASESKVKVDVFSRWFCPEWLTEYIHKWTQMNKNKKHHALNDKLILINVEHCLHSMQEWLRQINLLSYESYIPFCLMWTSPISNQRGPFSKTTILNAVLTLIISNNKNILFTLILIKTTVLTIICISLPLTGLMNQNEMTSNRAEVSTMEGSV